MSIRNFKTSGNFHWFKTGNSLSPYRKKWDSGGGDIIMPLRNVLRIHLTIYWCWLNICVPPKFVIWNPNPHCDGVRKWDLGEMIRSRWSALINGINDLVKETPERLFPSSTVWGPRRKMSLYESGIFAIFGICQHLDLGLPKLQKYEKYISVVNKPPGLC